MLPVNNEENVSIGDSKSFRQISLTHPTPGIHRSNLKNLLLREHVVSNVFSVRSAPPSLAVPVVIVVGFGPQKQVVGSDAWRIIALVKYAQPIGNRPVMENPTCVVSQNHKVAAAASPHSTVAEMQRMRNPQPAPHARRVDVNLGPKAFLERGRQSLRGEIFGRNVNLCGVSHNPSCRVRAVTGRAGPHF